MGGNRALPQPEAYPVSFLSAIRNGGGVLYAADLPWTVGSSGKRFRLLLALLKDKPGHPLHSAASQRWGLSITPRALIITCASKPPVARLAAPLIASALAIGENPNTNPPPADA